MAELDSVPQTQNVEIATVKLDDATFERIKQLNSRSNLLVSDFGTAYIRRKQLYEDIQKLDELVKKAEEDYQETQNKLNEIGDELDEKYPQARINIVDGTVQYQPGALTRKQVLARQQEQALQGLGNQ